MFKWCHHHAIKNLESIFLYILIEVSMTETIPFFSTCKDMEWVGLIISTETEQISKAATDQTYLTMKQKLCITVH